ncbi:MAG: retroviral-like aspartic protease family protein, partial [Candidatus Thiodiazotropha sp.]
MKCRKKNHFARCCQSSRIAQIGEAEAADSIESEPEYAINTINNRQSAMFARMQVNGHDVKFQLDSGASINIMPKRFATNMQIKATQGVLKMWNGTRTKPLGTATAIVSNPQDQRAKEITFMIVDEDLP